MHYLDVRCILLCAHQINFLTFISRNSIFFQLLNMISYTSLMMNLIYALLTYNINFKSIIQLLRITLVYNNLKVLSTSYICIYLFRYNLQKPNYPLRFHISYEFFFSFFSLKLKKLLIVVYPSLLTKASNIPQNYV